MFMEAYKMKRYFLPVLAVLCAVAAVIVLTVVPRSGGNRVSDGGQSGGYAERDDEGNVIIQSDVLSTDTISFYRLENDSAVELIAIRSEDGTPYAALGTCQSCNGSPKAYYTQEGDKLKCNNCGLTFPISVLDNPGGGCHPIMLDETLLQYQGNDLVMDLSSLLAYEYLFSKVVNH